MASRFAASGKIVHHCRPRSSNRIGWVCAMIALMFFVLALIYRRRHHKAEARVEAFSVRCLSTNDRLQKMTWHSCAG
jgi:hypothetical protein